MIWLVILVFVGVLYVAAVAQRTMREVAEMSRVQAELVETVSAAVARIDAEIDARWRPLENIDWSTFRPTED